MIHRWFECVTRGNLEVVKALLDAGYDINAQDSDGWTALHWANCNEDLSLIKLLLKYGASINIPDKNQCTVLFYVTNKNVLSYIIFYKRIKGI